MRHVRELLNTQNPVWSLKPQDSVFEALKILSDHDVGALMVMDEGKLVGILSERDVVRVIAQHGEGSLKQPISSCMTRDVEFAEPTETVDDLMTRMTDRRFRHLPVCKDDHLLGIVSIGDLVKSKIAETEAEAEELKAYIAQA